MTWERRNQWGFIPAVIFTKPSLEKKRFIGVTDMLDIFILTKNNSNVLHSDIEWGEL